MIKIQNLTKAYQKKKVVCNLTMDLENQVYGLLGPNGSGKTTLLRMLAGVLLPTAGKIEIDRNSIGYLPQKFGCFPELTVKEQLEYFACLKKIPKKLHEEEIDLVLDIIHLSDRKKDACRKLSGGMVRRMGIAQALLGNPKILLLDEPTVGLDPEERNHFHSIIYKIKGKMSIILSTHLVEDVEDLCENIIILINGQIRKAGTTEQILQELQGRVFEIPEKQAQAFGDSVYIESHFKKENEPMARLVVLEENLNLAETYSPFSI